MNDPKPLISIIVPTYKNFIYLADCLRSILEQDYSRFELIVVDDGSGDFNCQEWCDFIKKQKSENLVNYLVYSNETNLGTVKSLNSAIKKCRGDFIKIIACDDALYCNSTLSSFVSSVEKNDLDCFVGNVALCDDHLNENALADNKFISSMDSKSPKNLFSKTCCRNNINAAGVFFRKVFFDKNGLFDDRFKLIEDWPTWLGIFNRGEKIGYVNITVAKRRVATGVVSNNNPIYLKDKKNIWRFIIAAERKKIGLFVYLKSGLITFLSTVPLFRRIAYLFVKKR